MKIKLRSAVRKSQTPVALRDVQQSCKAGLQTVSTMVEHSGSALAAYMAEVLSALRACLSDPFHEVVIPTCNCMALLARQLRRRLQPVSKQLVADVLPLTTHRRKAVRCSAVRAVRQFMFCGAHEMILDMVAWQDPNSVAIKAFYEADPKVCSQRSDLQNYFSFAAPEPPVATTHCALMPCGQGAGLHKSVIAYYTVLNILATSLRILY